MPNRHPRHPPAKDFARPATREPVQAGISPKIVLALCALTLATTLWGGAATWYILFRDEFAQTFLARQTEMRIAYEDRVADLRNRLEREITSGLVERKAFAARVDALTTRQAEIESRQIWIASLADRLSGSAPSRLLPEPAGTLLPSRAVETTGSIPTMPGAKPMPVAAEPLDLRLRGHAPAVPSVPDRLSGVELSLGRASAAAVGSAETIRQAARERVTRLRLALEATRLPVSRLSPREPATGGPFVPLPQAFDAAGLRPIAADAEGSVGELERLGSVARSLPLGRPMFGPLEQTSSFGARLDPFNRAAAMHTGVDFRAEAGAPVRSTAAGRVTVADYSGGYGNMVEVEHEGGVSTRYAHLSAITVAPGQRVDLGQIVGRAGSTGRSTGTHLHYETRIDGEPVNPARFFEAGRLLEAAR
ncbi:M23 family metallopeptidase [Enterovirga rhinocerotis]|uniref:Peptidase M23-like protein n=1 Tax=Enterovirga rhinocerotis TaxID=1339210 RepID=A0A4R7BMK6_9HYPH|nr:M23 family metallopeptidase [Enterovirga rhinocerotis]TDR85525.1 peptidase M23-like protein [Enterovirga rhinocerotis]